MSYPAGLMQARTRTNRKIVKQKKCWVIQIEFSNWAVAEAEENPKADRLAIQEASMS